MRRMLCRIMAIGLVFQAGTCTSTFSERNTAFVGTAYVPGGGGGGGVIAGVPSAGQAFTPGQAPRPSYNAVFGAGNP